MRRMRWMAAVAGVAVVIAGCSADMGDSDTVEDAEAPVVDTGGDEASSDGGEQEEPADDGGEGDADGVVTFGGSGDAIVGRELARTATVVLEVRDVEQAAARVTAAAQRAGGFVSGADVRGGDFGYGVLTLRVPASALDATITDLAEVGVRVVESSISTEDLTDQLTDIGARISNLERLEAELQLLLSDVRTNDPQAGQLLQVFERLNQVRGEIERLEAQRSSARDRVDLATINVELVPTSTAPEEMEPEPEGTLAQAWETTKDAFGVMGDAAIWLVVTILPVAAILLGVPALLLWGLVSLFRRRRSDRHAETEADVPAPPAPPATAPDHEPADV